MFLGHYARRALLVIFCTVILAACNREDDDAQPSQTSSSADAICGQAGIIGRPVGAISHDTEGCGIADAVEVRSVSGITLSQPALMDCITARALNQWTQESVKPAFSKIGGGVTGYRVAAHYVCRTRNHRAGARISEHGKGKAIDISGFILEDGRVLDLETGWNGPNQSAFRAVHRGACGPFGTVLGPESDRYHLDHFHFDTAEYRSGPYCR